MKLIDGWDYTAKPGHEKLSMQAARWRELAEQVIKAGGRVRVEAGETFLHGADSRIRYEIYGYIGKVSQPAGGDPPVRA